MADTILNFTSDLSEFTSTVTDGGDMAWDSGSIAGHAGRVGFNIDDTTAIYGTKTGMTTSDEYRYELLIDINTLTLANSDHFWWMNVPNDANATHRLMFRKTAGGVFQLSAALYSDGFASSNETTVTWGSWDTLEVHVKRGAAGAGFCKLYAGGDYTTPKINITGVSNDTVWGTNGGCASFRVGPHAGLDAGTSGLFYISRITMRNTGVQIGSASAAPTVTDISNQTGTFGTQKTVACTIADTDSDIVRCDVSTNGTALITLTASGAASVTNNGTTAPYVTGTHTDVVATLGNNIKLDGVRDGTELSHVETITVLVTDSLDATGNDTFTMTWSVPTGVGTQTLYLTGTQAQINAMLATVELTPTEDFTGTIQCLMYSVTSTPLTDTDTFNITVSEVSTGPADEVLYVIVRRRRQRRMRREERRARR